MLTERHDACSQVVMPHTSRQCSLFALLAALAACESPAGIPTTGNGELHQGTFVYACSSPSDVQCGATALPLGIAVGADFDLSFEPTLPGVITLEPSTSFFTVDSAGHFHTTRAGYGAVLVINASGAAVDFVNLHMDTITSFVITGVDPAITLAVGETRTLHAAAFDAAGEPLAGTLTLEWESESTAIADVTVTDADRPFGTATLRADAEGSARIRVVSGSSTGTIDIKVGGA